MSSEWTRVKIGEVGSVKSGKRLPLGHTLSAQPTAFPYIRLVDVASGRVQQESLQFLKPETRDCIKRYVVNDGDVCLAIVGHTIGMVFFIEDEFDGVNLTENAARITAFKDFVNSKYVYYYLTSPVGQAAIQSRIVGSAQGKLPLYNINSLELDLPSRHSQDSVAAFLEALDDRITLLRETNATLEAIAQALFKSWFVDFDPVRAKMAGRAPEGMDEATAALFPDALEETELGLVPKGWRVGSLDDVAALNPESWSTKHHPDRIFYVDLANTKANQIEGITEFGFEEAPSRARRVLRQGDVVVGTVRPGNRSFARISVDTSGLTGSTGFAVLRAHDECDQALVYIAATRDESIERLAHLADGGAYPAVRPEVVGSTPLQIAPMAVRKAFGQVANYLLASVGSHQEQCRYLGELRDTLLPRLISGQLRLPEAHAQLEDALA